MIAFDQVVQVWVFVLLENVIDDKWEWNDGNEANEQENEVDCQGERRYFDMLELQEAGIHNLEIDYFKQLNVATLLNVI